MSHKHRHTAHSHGHSSRAGFPWGLLLGLIGATAICWLGITGRLNLYIHPRYNLFTIVMAGLAAVAAVASWAAGGRGGDGRNRAAVLTAAAMVVALLIVPPSTLSAASVQQRSPNSGTGAETAWVTSADPATFKLRDWAVLVADPGSAAKYSGQRVKMIGFVTPIDKRSETFYLTRFVVTCCTVDARPAVVPVIKADWAKTYRADQWLEVTGRLVQVEDAPGGAVLAVQPSEISSISEPKTPYEY